jgi:hypothetical protein
MNTFIKRTCYGNKRDSKVRCALDGHTTGRERGISELVTAIALEQRDRGDRREGKVMAYSAVGRRVKRERAVEGKSKTLLAL